MSTYPPETLDPDYDDGTMPSNVDTLAEAVVGQRIVTVEKDVRIHDRYYGTRNATVITLDNGKRVSLVVLEDSK